MPAHFLFEMEKISMIRYTDDGYLRIDAIIKKGYFFNIVIGARGTGKTFGALKYAVERKTTGKFLFIRRTGLQAGAMGKEETSPFKAVNNVLGTSIKSETINRKLNISGFRNGDNLIGYGGALTTFANFRGIDFSDVDLIIYDEFIKEKHERKLNGEGGALVNLIETVNRNRELIGVKPVQVICLANSNDIFNELFIELSLVLTCEKMIARGNEEYYDKERGLLLYVIQNSPISAKKKKTALYKLVNSDSEFYQMSIKNSFNMDESETIRSLPIKGFKPLCAIGEICIYETPNRNDCRYYVAAKAVGNGFRRYTLASADIGRFKTDYKFLWQAFFGREIVFETYYTSKLFEKYFINVWK